VKDQLTDADLECVVAGGQKGPVITKNNGSPERAGLWTRFKRSLGFSSRGAGPASVPSTTGGTCGPGGCGA
jgi:hypothetical protein